ncbi:MAG: hypothetical protein ABI426_01625 [Flavobacterium sp.]
MEAKFKITIPKPCHEDWNAMSPDETGKFCGSCVKSVVDFTNMNVSEIQDYFIINDGKNVCGRFKNTQVNKFNLEIPQSVLNQKMPFRKAFLLMLFVVMGSTLFSCKNNDGSTLGEVAVVNDSIVEDSRANNDNTTTGAPIFHKNSQKENQPPKAKIDEVKFVKEPLSKRKVKYQVAKSIPNETPTFTLGIVRSHIVGDTIPIEKK